MIAITHGRTAPIPYTLTIDGAPAPLVGVTVELVGTDKDGVGLGLAGSVVVTNPDLGEVEFQPAAGDIDESRQPYWVHFKVTDGAGKISFFPEGPPEKWRIYPQ